MICWPAVGGQRFGGASTACGSPTGRRQAAVGMALGALACLIIWARRRWLVAVAIAA
jgi:hypothetical protein